MTNFKFIITRIGKRAKESPMPYRKIIETASEAKRVLKAANAP
jgi:hypothetical protein